MTDWARAMNPTSPLTTEAEALAAARASAIAIFLGALWGVANVIYLMTAGREAMAAALAQSAEGTPEMASMAGQVAVGLSIFFVVLQLILGFVQWAKPNKVIPILFIILVVYGIGSAALGQLMAGSMDVPAAAQAPLWLTLIGYIVMLIELVLHVAGVRGASKLDQIRMDAAQTY